MTPTKHNPWLVRTFAGAGAILLATAAIAVASHFSGHEDSVNLAEKSATKQISVLQKDFYEKFDKLTEAIAAVHDEIQVHAVEGGIHQTPDEKAAARFKTATEVVDKRIGRLEGQIAELQKDIRSFITTERETIIERLLKLETQQVALIKAIETLGKRLEKR